VCIGVYVKRKDVCALVYVPIGGQRSERDYSPLSPPPPVGDTNPEGI